MSDFSNLFEKIVYFGKYKKVQLFSGYHTETWKIYINGIDVEAELTENREKFINLHHLAVSILEVHEQIDSIKLVNSYFLP